ncbi:DUF484 family protein [Stagnimonas aquatica]|uniref:DUF484 family protein n=1 Tax=Stagnimonas aquatica TaxID=2689987 RepID=A0A3N0VJW1_9GAMM|nr:DUF484 family protein [Stagnimonas aquatica]ROH93039.1 DUF484 family protein [Stagnimonas aquatica]
MAELDAVAEPAAPVLDEKQVVAYLKSRPEFLLRHPELLEHLEVVHATGSAVSLIERQVDLLRGKNLKLEDRLARLLETAADNEKRAANVHKLARTLIRAPSLAAVVAGLRSCMKEDFGVDEVTIGVNANVYKRHDIEGFVPLEPDSALVRAFENFIRTRLIECGPLDAERAKRLFPKAEQPILSAAIVPLEKEKNLGLVALGSREAERFQPRQGKLFLEMTAELVAAALRARLG